MPKDDKTIKKNVSVILKISVILAVLALIYIESTNNNLSIAPYIYVGLFGIAYGLDKDDIIDIIKAWFNKGKH
mgnify:CR=1 FL=1